MDIKPYEDNYEKSLQVKRLYKRINALLAGILLSVKTYRKKMEACDNLIDSLESE